MSCTPDSQFRTTYALSHWIRFASVNFREFVEAHESVYGRLCCKSRKLQSDEFFAKIKSKKQLPIRMTSIALPKSPVSLS